ncbi:CyP450 monooxygenase [Lentinus tigrinus ALCF2SS1-7]|uniref:CyP450 monooxygenase n=1 Tax=Lentinus tigrinus ALCF2SS1-6 TaxID=1328759 RepID=A0A5C2SMI5_9APHY|nr:CyP450 monooxygenase [Lentinus tigrinus ALCF2SS1-6]RPD77540.1 CyP450 monooxygenase [Lentinus tigrinus ALCF2SS1-7]
MALSPTSALAAALCGLILIIRYIHSRLSWRARSKGRPLPPGPQPFPVVGNLLDIPKSMPWEAYRDLSVRYGDVLFFRVLGQSLMILGNAKVVFELLEKRSVNYSDRPQSPMFDLIGWDFDFGFMPYGQYWRRHRRLFWQHFHPGVISKYNAIQGDVSRAFLGKLLTCPERLEEHIRHTFAASILKVVYGIDIAERGDKLIEIIEVAMEGVAEGLTPGAFLVEYFPFLRHVPAWFPGAGFQTRLKKWRDASHAMVDLPFAQAKAHIKDGSPPPSVVNSILSDFTQSDDPLVSDEEQIAKNVAAIAYAGGADTTISTFQTFFLAMSLHLEVRAKAQAELHAVVGPNRLPDHSDRDDLPYIEAIIKECLRWQNATPMGIPHAVTEDDEYEGYFIPAGTVVFANVWAVLHDQEEYPEPERFLPERFIKDGKLNPDVRDPGTAAFGFGRRICPGRHFAEAALFVNIARVLHVFDIGPPLDERGEVINVEPKMKDGILSYPENCRCTIKPRSAQAECLIDNGERDES